MFGLLGQMKVVALAGVAAAGIAAGAPAASAHEHFSIGISLPAIFAPRPTVIYQQPVYTPAPVYAAPVIVAQPEVCAPAPVYYQPAPVYYHSDHIVYRSGDRDGWRGEARFHREGDHR